MTDSLLANSVEVPFARVESALAGREQACGPAPVARALTATVVAVGPEERLVDAAGALQPLAESGAVRAVLVALGSTTEPAVRVRGNAVLLTGLRDAFVDNAVAALRLSSLPTLLWWRGGPPTALADLSKLAERVVIDVDPPEPVWTEAVAILRRTAVTDLRWTRLTRWRALMAQFFDVPRIRDATFTRLVITGCDPPSASLFASWMKASLGWNDAVRIEIRQSAGAAPVEAIALGNGAIDLRLCVAPSGRCVQAQLRSAEQAGIARVLSLGDQTLTTLLLEELRIRSHDAAFERALRACVAAE
jgi:glucose-6-phosphate dehydrogenase assembly protein OpcA